MADQILRTAKLKKVGNVTGSLQHMLRENGKAQNANPKRSSLNQNSVGSVREAMRKFRALEPEYKQKNNVEAIEFMVTASPDFFKNQSSLDWQMYLNDALQWIKKMVGAKNIVASSIQLDETTPHLSVIARPIVERKFKGGRTKTALSAKRYLDGKALLSKMQDNFYDEVASIYNLKRGNKGSKAKHQTIQSWYGEQAGGAERVRELEKINEELKKKSEAERRNYFGKLDQLTDEIQRLRKEDGRWRKEATKLSVNWFSEDIQKAKSVESLSELRDEVGRSKILPRSSKRALKNAVDEKIESLKPKAVKKIKSR